MRRGRKRRRRRSRKKKSRGGGDGEEEEKDGCHFLYHRIVPLGYVCELSDDPNNSWSIKLEPRTARKYINYRLQPQTLPTQDMCDK